MDGERQHNIPSVACLQAFPIDVDGKFAFVCRVFHEFFETFSEIVDECVIVMLFDNVSSGGLAVGYLRAEIAELFVRWQIVAANEEDVISVAKNGIKLRGIL